MSFSKERTKIGEVNTEFLYPLHEIDSFNGEELKNYINSIMDEVGCIVINFSRITYFNSSGLRELIQILKKLKEQDKKLLLTAISEDIQKIFIHTNLDRLFIILPEDEDVTPYLEKL